MALTASVAWKGFSASVVLLVLLSIATPKATSATISANGRFTPSVVSDALAEPGATWAFSFDVDTVPAAHNPDALGFDAPFSAFTYAVNGASVAAMPAEIRFYTTSGGGLFTLFFGPESGFMNGLPIPEFIFSGRQVFSGTTTDPMLLSGIYPVADVIYSDDLNYDDEGASGNTIVTRGQAPTPVPEPRSTATLALSVILFAFTGMYRRLPCRVKRTGVPIASMALFFGLFAGAARADFVKTIEVVPNVQVTAAGTWYYANCTTSLGVGSYQIHVAPSHGSVSFAVESAPLPGCPSGSPALPVAVAYYTWTDLGPGAATDYFQLYYLINGNVDEVIDVHVNNTDAQLGKTLGQGPCNCQGQSAAGGSSGAVGPLASSPLGALSPSGASSPSGRPRLRTASPTNTVSSGNMFYAVTDYTTSGQNTLDFTRYYNARGNMAAKALEGYATVVPLASGLNANWRSTYDRHLEMVSATSIVAERADGQRLNFTLSGSVWVPDSDVDMTLTQSGSSWSLTDSNDTVEHYTSAVPVIPGLSIMGYAALESVTLRNGYTQTLTYSGTELVSVTDSYRRSLSFTHSGAVLQSVTTPDGTVITYDYDGASRLKEVTYSTRPATSQTYLYENPGVPSALTGIIDENGSRYASWTYDAYGRTLTSQLGAGADATNLSYNNDGSRVVTNAFGVQDTYKFTMLQGVPKLSEVDRAATATTAAASELFTYDGNGYLASQTDWNGNQTLYVNNAHGQPTSITEASGSPVERTTQFIYDSTWVHLPSVIDIPGLITRLTYDAKGEVLTADYSGFPDSIWTYSWSNSLLASVKSPLGKTTSFTYDGSGALTAIANALGQTTRITSHTGGGLPLTLVDPNGVTTTMSYDVRQRLLSSTVATSAGPRITSLDYDPAGDLVKTTQPDGSALTSIYDAAHRLVRVTDLFHQNVNYVLDAMGDQTQMNLTAVGDRIQRQQSAGFDALGRGLSTMGGMGQTSTMTFDPNGNALTVTDPLGRTTHQTFDALNRLSATTDPSGGVTTIAYDAFDRPVSVTDANGHTTTYVYDGLGHLIEQFSPDTGVTLYIYDLDGNRVQKIDEARTVTNYTYDALERLATITYPSDATENVTYAYDEAGHGFGIGRLTSLTDAAGSLRRSYDERGNLLTETRMHGGTTFKTVNSYDAASRIASITYPSGWKVSYTRDAMGRTWQMPLTTPGGASAGNAITNATYEPFGPLYTLAFGNGVNETRRLDLDYRVTSLADTGAGVLQNLSYSYDSDDNVSAIADAVNPANSQLLGYDVLNRLTSATGSYGRLAYTYDHLGNRLEQTAGAAVTSYGYARTNNWLTSITSGGVTTPVTYTQTGNISSIPPTPGAPVAMLTYNAADRLASVAGIPLAVTGMVYDAFGQRFSKTSGGTSNYFTYGQDGNLIEENDGGFPIDYVYLNGRPVVDIQPSSGKVYFLQDDRLGTPQLATDGAQNAVWRASYQPFGTALIGGSVTQNLRFPGQYFDGETGWNHNGWRDYVPNLGRYLEADPLGLAGGLNRYLYVAGNPLKFGDKLGLDDFSNWGEGTAPTLEQQIAGDQSAIEIQEAMNQPEEQPGIVFNATFCEGGGCASITINQANVYLGAGVGVPGASCSLVFASNMQAYSAGGTGQIGYKYGSAGGNLDSGAVGLQLSTPGVGGAVTYSWSISQIWSALQTAPHPYPKAMW